MDEQHLPPDENAALATVARAADAADNLAEDAAQAEANVQIASQPEEEEEDSPESIIELGDSVVIKTERRGIIAGQIYYRDETLISVKLQNGSNVLVNFPQEDGDFVHDDEQFGEILAYNIVKKRAFPSFIEQHNLRAGQLMDVFMPNGAIDPNNVYTIKAVDPENDTIMIADPEGRIEPMNFDFTGIPRSRPFRVIATRDPPEEEEGDVVQQRQLPLQMQMPLPLPLQQPKSN